MSQKIRLQLSCNFQNTGFAKGCQGRHLALETLKIVEF